MGDVLTLIERAQENITEADALAMEQADTLRRQGIDLDTLSMGMTADYRAAIFEGATIVRIGTALFGERG